MATIMYRTITVQGKPHPVKLVFRSRLVRGLNLIPFVEIGGLVLSAGTIRFKRSPHEIPRSLVAHELGHVIQAKGLGWRYLPTYLLHRGKMEQVADWFGRQVESDNLPDAACPVWLDKFAR